MPDSDFQPLTPASLSWADDVPHAPQFGDSYFSRDGGPAETTHVFIDGNTLRERFAALPARGQFVLAETGFGTGLNYLVATVQFLEHAPADATLHYLSVEKHPLTPNDLSRAHAPWRAMAEQADDLRKVYPPLVAGFHRRHPHPRIRLTLMFGDASAMLEQLDAQVDAWFLDGFAPSRNTGMWQPEVFAQMARLSRPGATFATFTAAGFVRRALTDAGFNPTRRQGFGRKREMLCGSYGREPWVPRPASPGQRVAVIGAGLAGACVADALAQRGCEIEVFDPLGVAQAASGNRAGVVYTTPSAHPTAQNRFYQSSFIYALDRLKRADFPRTALQGQLSGVMQRAKDVRQAERAEAALASGLWPKDLVQSPADGCQGSLWFPGGGYLSPADWCRTLLQQPGIRMHQHQVKTLQTTGQSWRLITDGTADEAFDQVVLANAAAAAELVSLPGLRLKNIRGQVTHVRATAASRQWQHAWCHAGYLTPALEDLHCVGATFDLHEDTVHGRKADDARNLAELRAWLPDKWADLGGEACEVLGHRVGFRCQSPDFLPLAGPAPQAQRLWLSIAHGSRGITGTPLCAEVIASALLGEPSPVDRDMHQALLPERFALRAAAKR